MISTEQELYLNIMRYFILRTMFELSSHHHFANTLTEFSRDAF